MYVARRPYWYVALVIVTLFFTLNGFLAYRTSLIMRQNTDSISNTLNIINLIEQSKVQLFTAESGQRGYLITEDEQYLTSYYESTRKLQSLLDTLAQSTTEIPSQKDRFTELYSYLLDKLKEMNSTIELVKSDDEKSAFRITDTDHGFNLSLKILDLIEEMEHEEHVLLSIRRQEADENQNSLLTALLLTNLVGLLLSIITIYAVFLYSRRIESLYLKVEQANQALEEKVRERTAALEQYSEELERSNRELEDFAFVASHDLQEPLRKIRAFGDRLLKTYGSVIGEQGQDYIARMHSASERMSRLIEDLLSFSRVSTRQKSFQQCDLNELFADATNTLEISIEERSADIQIEPLPCIEGDPAQLRQVFTNLLSNSIKFTQPNIQPKIIISNSITQNSDTEFNDAPPKLAIRIQDNGIGFDIKYKDRIFNLFQRLHGKQAYSGTGIGLAICRKIVERHGGEIQVQSEEGKGTVFIIHLPVTQPKAVEWESEKAAAI